MRLNTASQKRKEMTVYVSNIYVHNIKTDYLTKEEITRKDIQENKVKVCLGVGTYFNKNFLTEEHFNLSHKPVLDFTEDHNFKVFLKKNEAQVSKNENDICFVNYNLAITNIGKLPWTKNKKKERAFYSLTGDLHSPWIRPDEYSNVVHPTYNYSLLTFTFPCRNNRPVPRNQRRLDKEFVHFKK